MGKDKEAKKAAKESKKQDDEVEKEEVAYESKLKFCSIIAKPLADEKLCKKVLKLAKKATKRKAIRRGVKEVVKALRKNSKGICVLAGDISPVDVLTHIPIICEDHSIPYIYVPSKEPPKGAVDGEEQKEYAEAYAEAEKKIKAAMPVF